MLLMIWMIMKLLGHFMKKNYKKLISKNLGKKKLSRKKLINYMSNGKVTTVHLIAGLIERLSIIPSIVCLKMSK